MYNTILSEQMTNALQSLYSCQLDEREEEKRWGVSNDPINLPGVSSMVFILTPNYFYCAMLAQSAVMRLLVVCL